MSEVRFFVVRPGFGGQPSYSIEYGDHSNRYSKEERYSMIDRIELPLAWAGTLADAIRDYEDVKPGESQNFQKEAAKCAEALGAAFDEAFKHFEERVVIGAGFAVLVQAYKDHMPADFTKEEAAQGLSKMLGGYFAQIFLNETPAAKPCAICGHIGHHDPRCAMRGRDAGPHRH